MLNFEQFNVMIYTDARNIDAHHWFSFLLEMDIWDYIATPG